MILLKEINKPINAVDKEKEIRIAEYKRHFNEKYERARNIKKIRIKKRLKEMVITVKNKQ
jgi:hypothetical protein